MSNATNPTGATIVADLGIEGTIAAPLSHPALDVTVAAPPSAASSGALPSVSGAGGVRSTVKSCVLPTFGATDVAQDRLRYEVKKVLGEGGMGEVALAIDHDIGRSVALKHLHHQIASDASSLARFVEEIHTVGSLEHPNIVPIHDVGIGADGRYFFVMKHVEGETLESIIEKLAAGDVNTHATYTYTTRMEIMIGLLRALDYAHAHGIVHRDIKPANVMIGPYGEVVLMDWGVAKAKIAAELPRGPEATAIASDNSRMRLFTTRHGSLVGTPAYMSPEQARGENAAVDERSDLYSATVLFHEFLCLRHYLSDKTTLPDMIRGVTDDIPNIFDFALNQHAAQGLPPAELLHVCRRGLQKNPSERFQSAREMIHQLEDSLEGKVHVQCPFTLTKRMTRESGRFVDNYPRTAVLSFLALIGLVIFSFVMTIRALI